MSVSILCHFPASKCEIKINWAKIDSYWKQCLPSTKMTYRILTKLDIVVSNYYSFVCNNQIKFVFFLKFCNKLTLIFYFPLFAQIDEGVSYLRRYFLKSNELSGRIMQFNMIIYWNAIFVKFNIWHDHSTAW